MSPKTQVIKLSNSVGGFFRSGSCTFPFIQHREKSASGDFLPFSALSSNHNRALQCLQYDVGSPKSRHAATKKYRSVAWKNQPNRKRCRIYMFMELIQSTPIMELE